MLLPLSLAFIVTTTTLLIKMQLDYRNIQSIIQKQKKQINDMTRLISNVDSRSKSDFHSKIDSEKSQDYDLTINTLSVLNMNGSLNIGGNDSNGFILSLSGDSEYRGNLTVDKSIITCDLVHFSDQRLKESIQNIKKEDSDRLLDLQGVTFKWKNGIKQYTSDSTVEYGLIAQDVMKQFPDIVLNKSTLTKGYYAVDYVKLIPIIIEKLKDHDQIITGLQQE